MKKLHLKLCIAALILVGFSSCVKQVDQISTTGDTTVTNTSGITTSEAFNWSTTNKINFVFTGSEANDYQLILNVTASDGTVLFKKLQKGNEDYKSIIEIPSTCETVTINYGSTSKSFNTKTGTISMTIN